LSAVIAQDTLSERRKRFERVERGEHVESTRPW
jgi:hypothetical protein